MGLSRQLPVLQLQPMRRLGIRHRFLLRSKPDGGLWTARFGPILSASTRIAPDIRGPALINVAWADFADVRRANPLSIAPLAGARRAHHLILPSLSYCESKPRDR